MLKFFQKIAMVVIMTMPLTGFANNPIMPSPQTQMQFARVNFTPIFVRLSDIMTLVKTGETDRARSELNALAMDFAKLPIDTAHTALTKRVAAAFDTAQSTPNNETLQALSIALYDLEKAQNPVDYRQDNAKFAQKIRPAIKELGEAIDAFKVDGNLDALRMAYDKFNKSWGANERVVRNTQQSHYGAIEMAMALLRVAIETKNIANMDARFHDLQAVIDSYIKGESLAKPKVDMNVDLAYGINLLEQGLHDFQANDVANGQAKLSEFIQKWVVFEGEVSARNPGLYSKIESQIPIIMATGDANAQQKLADLIGQLKQINPTVRYTAVDSMLILLREGLEALLIVIALMAALNASGQTQGKKWVYGGVSLGIFGSVLGAVIFYQLFPKMAGGMNREMLEGVVGLVAVVMMIGVGAWLHSKSSIKAWHDYIHNQLGRAMTTGSFISLFLLSFLSVFREGAETILFYVGILPNIGMVDFFMGIGLALLILVAMAVILLKTSVKLPIPLLFKILTATIYVLGFKILGVSILALQLTNHLPRTMVNMPSMEIIGFYPSVQGMMAQLAYMAILIVLQLYAKKPLRHIKA